MLIWLQKHRMWKVSYSNSRKQIFFEAILNRELDYDSGKPKNIEENTEAS